MDRFGLAAPGKAGRPPEAETLALYQKYFVERNAWDQSLADLDEAALDLRLTGRRPLSGISPDQSSRTWIPPCIKGVRRLPLVNDVLV